MTRVRRSTLQATAYLYFETVARCNSVRRSANELHVVDDVLQV